ncbi:MAG TPA: HPr kinase/phosphatase C-terminal domain-containing protein, partial [Sphingomicrobium sp.]|nr:HPr kinase/phosphatase C-terminal domain-containing protein [Sphingomicrobium sp.]
RRPVHHHFEGGRPAMTARLSSENLHASTVAVDGRAVLITGPSGSGKSDLALRMLDRGFNLVSDDRTIVRRSGDKLLASAPDTIKGKLEIRGVGIVDMEHISDVPVALVVELTSQIQRLPDDSRERLILGMNIPLISVDAMTASAPSKVAIALDRIGLKV